MQPSDIDSEAFQTAHDLALSNVPEERREEEFAGALTRHLISELCRMGNRTALEERQDSTEQVQAALEEIHRTKNGQWLSFLKSRMAMQAALEHNLALQAPFTMPPSIRRITQSLKIPSDLPPADPEKDHKG